jgi:hypothetical protein
MTKQALLFAVLVPLTFAEPMPLPWKTVSAPGKLHDPPSPWLCPIFRCSPSGRNQPLSVTRVKVTGIPMHGAQQSATLVIECREGGSEYPRSGKTNRIVDVSSWRSPQCEKQLRRLRRGLETLCS